MLSEKIEKSTAKKKASPAPKLGIRARRAIDALVSAAEAYGWSSDQGTSDRAAADKLDLDVARAEIEKLMARLEAAAKRERGLTVRVQR